MQYFIFFKHKFCTFSVIHHDGYCLLLYNVIHICNCLPIFVHILVTPWPILQLTHSSVKVCKLKKMFLRFTGMWVSLCNIIFIFTIAAVVISGRRCFAVLAVMLVILANSTVRNATSVCQESNSAPFTIANKAGCNRWNHNQSINLFCHTHKLNSRMNLMASLWTWMHTK